MPSLNIHVFPLDCSARSSPFILTSIPRECVPFMLAVGISAISIPNFSPAPFVDVRPDLITVLSVSEVI